MLPTSMADTDVADMKGNENLDLPQKDEKGLAEAKGDTEVQGGEESLPATAGNEEE